MQVFPFGVAGDSESEHACTDQSTSSAAEPNMRLVQADKLAHES